MSQESTQLLDRERLFCELFANGEAPFGGDAARCYEEAYNVSSNLSLHLGQQLLGRPEIQEYLKTLESEAHDEAKYMKVFIKQNLMNIVKECSTAEFVNRHGTRQSPAAMRSVAVSASRALMELFPVKDAPSKSGCDEAGKKGITFNVIMPSSASPSTPPEITTEITTD